MTDTLTIWHNPRCSKSRQTLQLLEAHGHQPQVFAYLDEPLDATTLNTVLSQLGISPRDLLRSGEQAYKDLGLKDNALSDEQLVAAMVEQPKLIQRPIVIRNDKAALGRPPEAVLDLFD